MLGSLAVCGSQLALDFIHWFVKNGDVLLAKIGFKIMLRSVGCNTALFPVALV